MTITGEIDVNGALAQLANARYAPESVNGSGSPTTPRQGAETLTVLTSLAEVRAAVNEIAATAQRLISIYTPDLEPDLYDQSAFLEVIKHFVLTRSFAKVRVLLAEPTRVLRDSNRFVAMGRRLSSCIDIRYVAAAVPAARLDLSDRRRPRHRLPHARRHLGRRRRHQQSGGRARLPAGIRPGLERQRRRARPALRPPRLSFRPLPSLPSPRARGYTPPMPRTPEVTVAAVTETAGRFLIVEERVNRRLLFNQPAGHVEPGESLLAAVVREAREETAWRFEPAALLGVYLWRNPRRGTHHTALRLHRHGRRPRRRAAARSRHRAHALALGRRPRGARGRSCAARWSCAACTTTSAADRQRLASVAHLDRTSAACAPGVTVTTL